MAVRSHLVIKLNAPYPVTAAASSPQRHGDMAPKGLQTVTPNSAEDPSTPCLPPRRAKHSWEDWRGHRDCGGGSQGQALDHIPCLMHPS